MHLPPRKGVRMTQREIDISILDFLLWVISEGSQPSWFPPEKKIANECNCERRKPPVMQRENPRSISPFRDSCYDIGEAGRSHIRIERRTDLDCAPSTRFVRSYPTPSHPITPQYITSHRFFFSRYHITTQHAMSRYAPFALCFLHSSFVCPSESACASKYVCGKKVFSSSITPAQLHTAYRTLSSRVQKCSRRVDHTTYTFFFFCR